MHDHPHHHLHLLHAPCSGTFPPCPSLAVHAGEVGDSGDAQYLVKWVGRSHLHNEWVPGVLLLRLAKRKLVNFKRRYGAAPCLFMQDAWRIAERLVARRPSPAGPGWEVLVKWADLDYSECTWEACPAVLHAPSGHGC